MNNVSPSSSTATSSTGQNLPYWIVLADTQLGAVHWQNPTREEDYYHAFQSQCYLAASDENCLGILGLGDLRERASIQAKNLGGLNRGLKILAEGGKPLLALMGNHDYTHPNWIEEMCYPSLKNLADPEVLADHGFNPTTTLALHFTPRSQLKDVLLSRNPERISLMFLHQSLRELTTSLKQSHDLSLSELQEMGFGKTKPCTIFLGDLHNYGDASLGNISAAYPGSLEMTDANEGINGLRGTRVSSNPHDYRKFVIHYYPSTGEWTPVQTQARPWFRGKAKTKKESDRLEAVLKQHGATWSWEPRGAACIALSVPKTERERFERLLSELPILQAKVEEYNPDIDADANEDESSDKTVETTLSWQQNKSELLELAVADDLDAESRRLLSCIVESDGATHAPKHDILTAWGRWAEEPSQNPETPQTPQTPETPGASETNIPTAGK
jgi:DNA repair exonuclease SbcCD nuclease subunit